MPPLPPDHPYSSDPPSLLDPHAIVFDFDGVIVDSEPLHAEALAAACAPHAIPFDAPRFVGWSDSDALRSAFAEQRVPLPEALLAELLSAKHGALLTSLSAGRITPYPGVLTLLRTLADLRAPLALCTAATRIEIEPALASLGLDRLFQSIVTREDTRRTKPHPDPYLHAARSLGASPARCIAVEDSQHGVASAKDAGFFVYAVEHTTPPERLARADRRAPTIAHLAPFLLAPWEKRQSKSPPRH